MQLIKNNKSILICTIAFIFTVLTFRYYLNLWIIFGSMLPLFIMIASRGFQNPKLIKILKMFAGFLSVSLITLNVLAIFTFKAICNDHVGYDSNIIEIYPEEIPARAFVPESNNSIKLGLMSDEEITKKLLSRGWSYKSTSSSTELGSIKRTRHFEKKFVSPPFGEAPVGDVSYIVNFDSNNNAYLWLGNEFIYSDGSGYGHTYGEILFGIDNYKSKLDGRYFHEKIIKDLIYVFGLEEGVKDNFPFTQSPPNCIFNS